MNSRPASLAASRGKRDQLYSQRGERKRELLVPEAGDIFFRPGVEGRFVFHRNQSGKVDALIDRRNNEDLIWKKM